MTAPAPSQLLFLSTCLRGTPENFCFSTFKKNQASSTWVTNLPVPQPQDAESQSGALFRYLNGLEYHDQVGIIIPILQMKKLAFVQLE